ncbi:hypothetical protein HPB49_014081 [Dermacentor silvarum]|uniref:Uncharacterized protein n=2 Tax=Dermacentor silvarum TaxID=543639 RepID=A0ACB8E044_DERSI|nr:hypothetical protein HPB49_014081 [Dermacentor silvarum]
MIARMLIRDPDKRASLEEIAADPWLTAGDAPQPADHLPLIHREHLSEEDHSHIIQKMVNGCIANKDEILEALDRNEYNYMTATYYLLAERKLRAQRQEKAQQLNRTSRADLSPVAVTPGVSSATPSPAQERPNVAQVLASPGGLPSIALDPSVSHPLTSLLSVCSGPLEDDSSLAVPRSSLPLGRKCSIVREEDDMSSLAPSHSPPIRGAVFSEESESAECDERAVRPVLSLPTAPSGPSPPMPDGGSQRQSPTVRLRCIPGRRLHAVKSSPQLLGGAGDIRVRSGVGKLRVHAAGRNRTTSCSSSDDEEGDKRRHPPTAKGDTPLQGSPSGSVLPSPHAHDEGYSADSTDSLDILPDPAPRLTNSVSCGDLTVEESPASKSDEGASSAVQCADVVLVEEMASADAPRISNSFSLAAGLSCLGRKSSRDEMRSSRSRLGSSLAKLVPNGSRSSASNNAGAGALKPQLDINQNGFRKGRSKSQSGVVDVKLASKCCTLC